MGTVTHIHPAPPRYAQISQCHTISAAISGPKSLPTPTVDQTPIPGLEWVSSAQPADIAISGSISEPQYINEKVEPRKVYHIVSSGNGQSESVAYYATATVSTAVSLLIYDNVGNKKIESLSWRVSDDVESEKAESPGQAIADVRIKARALIARQTPAAHGGLRTALSRTLSEQFTTHTATDYVSIPRSNKQEPRIEEAYNILRTFNAETAAVALKIYEDVGTVNVTPDGKPNTDLNLAVLNGMAACFTVTGEAEKLEAVKSQIAALKAK